MYLGGQNFVDWLLVPVFGGERIESALFCISFEYLSSVLRFLQIIYHKISIREEKKREEKRREEKKSTLIHSSFVKTDIWK